MMVQQSEKEKLQLEKTLSQEIHQKACKMSKNEINEKIDQYIKLVMSGKLDEENLLVTKEKARLYAEILLRRG